MTTVVTELVGRFYFVFDFAFRQRAERSYNLSRKFLTRLVLRLLEENVLGSKQYRTSVVSKVKAICT